jgi:hypothetical protein
VREQSEIRVVTRHGNHIKEFPYAECPNVFAHAYTNNCR